jgi:lipoprotein-anchoring transpeptidase ErfK/SrfK
MISDRYNWTLGYPSLKNKDVDELYQWVQKGTVVEILP